MSANNHTLFLAGDTMITQPWSQVKDTAFIQLIEEIRNSDISIVNLETIIHEFLGYAQAHSGGSYMASPPAISAELKWAGIDMVSHANNHAFDYGPEGIIETLQYIGAAGIVIAGSGPNLQEARAPRFFVSNGTRVALVSMAATFVPYGIASRARHDMRGRPGLNPMRVHNNSVVTVTQGQARLVHRWASRLRPKLRHYTHEHFRLAQMQWRVGEKPGFVRGPVFEPTDLAGNLASIKQAAAEADLTVVALHAHHPEKWLHKFSQAAFDKGADVIVVHGPHEVRGVALIGGKPLFCGMGDFVYQTDQIARLPSEAYDRYGLDDNATVAEFHGDGRREQLQRQRATYEGYASILHYQRGKLDRIRLLPVDLQFDAPYGVRGRPQFGSLDFGRRLIAQVTKLSKQLGTRVVYNPDTNEGVIDLR